MVVCKLLNDLPAFVTAAIVDQQDLIRRRNTQQYRVEAHDKLFKGGLAVIYWNND